MLVASLDNWGVRHAAEVTDGKKRIQRRYTQNIGTSLSSGTHKRIKIQIPWHLVFKKIFMLANTPHTMQKARNHTNRRSLNVVTSPTQPPIHPSTPPHPSLPTPKSERSGLLAVSYRLRHLLLPEILAYHLAPATRVHSHFTWIPVSQAWRPRVWGNRAKCACPGRAGIDCTDCAANTVQVSFS